MPMPNEELSVREVQLSCLRVMIAFDEICKANHLTYFLSGGTLLGAIRHKGFIPWDDDVDLMMPRGDYERLIEIAAKLTPGRFELYSMRSKPDYSRPWVRMVDNETAIKGQTRFGGDTEATYIDIFPIDGTPEGKWATKCFYARLRVLDALCKSSKRNFTSEHERLKGLKAALRLLLKPIGARPLARAMNRIATRHPFESSAHRGVSMVTHYGAREKMPAEVFDRAVEVQFEDRSFPAPVGYDRYLSRLYGNYMELPPEHKRNSGHKSRYEKVGGEET